MGAAEAASKGGTMLARHRRSTRSFVGVLALAVVVLGVVVVATPASAAKKKPKPVVLATAAGWIDVATQAKLTPFGTPEQTTDTSSPRVAQMSSLLNGLAFKGLALQMYARTQADPSDPSLLVGNDILKVIVFGSAKDAQKFRDADANDVLAKGALKKVGTYGDGVLLDDGQGHINAMFTINNVVVDIRTGVAEKAPGDGVKDITKIADAVVAKSKAK
jgi:hypothetical protein